MKAHALCDINFYSVLIGSETALKGVLWVFTLLLLNSFSDKIVFISSILLFLFQYINMKTINAL